MPEVTVHEDDGASQVCVNSNTMSAQAYNIMLSHAGNGMNPATRKTVDFSGDA